MEVRTVGDLRALLDGVPDCTEIEVYSGSVESLVNFDISIGESRDEYGDNAERTVLTINAEN